MSSLEMGVWVWAGTWYRGSAARSLMRGLWLQWEEVETRCPSLFMSMV